MTSAFVFTAAPGVDAFTRDSNDVTAELSAFTAVADDLETGS